MKRHTRPPHLHAADPSQNPSHASPELDALLGELDLRTSMRVSTQAPHGRSIETGDGDSVRIRDAEGMIELEIRITPAGPRLVVRGAALELVGTKSVDVHCERFSVTAELGVSLHAPRGDVRLDAGDDVIAIGERILLN